MSSLSSDATIWNSYRQEVQLNQIELHVNPKMAITQTPDGSFYAFGGQIGGLNDELWFFDRAKKYQPAQIVNVGPAPSPRRRASAAVWGDFLIVFGGEDLKGNAFSGKCVDFTLETREINDW